MRSFVIVILIGSVWMCCRPENTTFNPFDNEFKFHGDFNLSDYDTVPGECGYWNLTNRNDGTYYQFYLDEKDIVAKGLNIDLDQLVVDSFNVEYKYDERKIVRILDSNPLDTNLLKLRLANFITVKRVRLSLERSVLPFLEGIELIDNNDSIRFADILVRTIETENQVKIARQFSYFNGKEY